MAQRADDTSEYSERSSLSSLWQRGSNIPKSMTRRLHAEQHTEWVKSSSIRVFVQCHSGQEPSVGSTMYVVGDYVFRQGSQNDIQAEL
jgi:hypothetical protein